jgi:predicted phage tail protein
MKLMRNATVFLATLVLLTAVSCAKATDTPPAADTTTPANVTELTAVAAANQVTLSWKEPADADFASVQITYPGLAAPITVLKGTMSYPVTGLTTGTQYVFTVKSVDATGNASAGVSTLPFIIVQLQ